MAQFRKFPTFLSDRTVHDNLVRVKRPGCEPEGGVKSEIFST
jgi:hypothetical protein